MIQQQDAPSVDIADITLHNREQNDHTLGQY